MSHLSHCHCPHLGFWPHMASLYCINYIILMNYNTLNKSLLTLVIALHVYPKLMSTLLLKPSTHSEEKKLSYSNLLKSRNLAACTSGYHNEFVRQALTKVCSERCHNIPYEWQLDAAEAFFLGLNCTILAGTGSGKSLPFVMPSMVHDKIVVVLSPLNALEDDQVC